MGRNWRSCPRIPLIIQHLHRSDPVLPPKLAEKTSKICGWPQFSLAFCMGMGMPFLIGLNRLADSAPDFIPRTWGINGFASVISASMATLLAIEFGSDLLIIVPCPKSRSCVPLLGLDIASLSDHQK